MKKLLIRLLLTAMCLSLVSCGGFGENETKVVQSIVYDCGDGIVTLTSKYYFEYEEEEITAYEYEQAVDGVLNFYTYGTINVDRTVGDSDPFPLVLLNNYVGKSYYFIDYSSYDFVNGEFQYKYKRRTYTALHLAYLEVNFISDDVFEVSYYDPDLKDTQTLRIKTDNYKMVYFTN